MLLKKLPFHLILLQILFEPSSACKPVDNQEQLLDRLRIIDRVDLNKSSLVYSDSSVFYGEKPSESLRQVFLIHRHGDRMPINLPLPKSDCLRDEPFWKIHGKSQLSNRGKERLYLLGKVMRSRYSQFLNNKVNKNIRVSRSSGSMRCIESAQMFLASFLGLDVQNSSDSSYLIWQDSQQLAHLWQPASIESYPDELDSLLGEGDNCANYESELAEQVYPEFERNNSKEYKEAREYLERKVDIKIDSLFEFILRYDTLQVEKSYFPDKIESDLVEFLNRFKRLYDVVYKAAQATFTLRRLQAGPFINSVISNMEETRQSYANSTGSPVKFLHYAAHDVNLEVLLGILDNIQPESPGFGSNMVFELHEIANDWFVRIFYMQSTPSKMIELHVDKCNDEEGRCSLSKFRQFVEPYMIESWQDWMSECDNDYQSLDPYHLDS